MAALLAHHRLEADVGVFALAFPVAGQSDPAHVAAQSDLIGTDHRDVVLSVACCLACATAGALVEVDRERESIHGMVRLSIEINAGESVEALIHRNMVDDVVDFLALSQLRSGDRVVDRGAILSGERAADRCGVLTRACGDRGLGDGQLLRTRTIGLVADERHRVCAEGSVASAALVAVAHDDCNTVIAHAR